MTLTPWMIQRAMIDRRGKVFNTTPERDFQAFTDFNRLPFKQNESRDFQARDRANVLRTYSFQMDFVEFADLRVFETWRATGFLPTHAAIKTDLEIDGKDHKDSADPWKDAAKNLAGIKVIHIPGYLCKRKMWATLRECLAIAQKQPERTVYLDEYSR